jgi:hypothetical protein
MRAVLRASKSDALIHLFIRLINTNRVFFKYLLLYISRRLIALIACYLQS